MTRFHFRFVSGVVEQGIQMIRWLVLFAVFTTICVETTTVAQSPDVTRPPAILNSAGSFSARRLSQPPIIDGRDWVEADVKPTYSPGIVPGPTRAFSLSLRSCGDHGGDFERCELMFQRGRSARVRINEITGWVFVTPDGRYVFTEPLYVLDVQRWVQYALFDALGIPNYVSIDAISRDGRRLFISRNDCGDCGAPREYFELTLPD
jgi:hypothetical protein